jgi:thiamine-phosphate diphosphorylase
VTDDEVVSAAGFADRVMAALAAGGRVCALQLRAHASKGRTLWDLSQRLAAAAEEAGASFWVNDRIDLALGLRAAGVQLGFRSLPVAVARELLGRSCWIGCSVHSASEAAAGFDAGADLAVLGSVYSTASHPDQAPLGLGSVREAAATGRPIVAIGGITPERVSEVIEAGAWGVAVLSGIWQARDPAVQLARYVEAIDRSRIEV